MCPQYDPDTKYKFFVYGTLKRKGALHGHLERWATDIQEAVVPGYTLYANTNFWFPLAVAEEGAEVIGELVEIETSHYDRIIALLDRIEAEGFLYNRTLVLTSE